MSSVTPSSPSFHKAIPAQFLLQPQEEIESLCSKLSSLDVESASEGDNGNHEPIQRDTFSPDPLSQPELNPTPAMPEQGMRRTKSHTCDLESLELAALNAGTPELVETPDFSPAPLLEEPDFSRQTVSPENQGATQPKALSFEQIRQMAENGPLTDLLIRSESNNGGLLYLEAIDMHRTFLDEWNRDRAFVNRGGAFGYEEVQAVCKQALQRYEEIASIPTVEELLRFRDIEQGQIEYSRRKALSPEIRPFFLNNLQCLTNELAGLQEKQGGQIGVFRQLLVDAANLRLILRCSGKMNPARTTTLLKSLRKLELELIRTLKAFQKVKEDFQPQAMIANSIAQGDFEGRMLYDLDGNQYPLKEPREDQRRKRNTDCRLVASFYRTYADNVLDPHLLYCSKFLTTVLHLKEHVGEMIETAASFKESAASD